MMEGKMHGKKMESAKMHYAQLMESLEALGLGLSEFEEMMEAKEAEKENNYEDEEEKSSEERPMDKSKIAIIVARMKNKMKGEE